jgi:hypothetical protein
MKKNFLILFFIFLFINVYSQNFKEYYFKFDINNKSELKELTKIISIDNVIENTVYAFSTNLDFGNFEKLGYDYTLIENAKSAKADMATSIAEMSDWNKYPTYDVYVEMMNSYASNYPEICKLIDLGTTVSGRSLLALKISDNVDTEENEPEFFYTSTMHGDETTGFVLMLHLIDSITTNYGSVSEITNLVDNIEIYINPNANPDGTYDSDNNTISYPTRYNANGVDLNRNFPCPTNGDHPDGNTWQPETVAMMSFSQNNRITVSANFHGGAELANYPWDNNYRRHADDDWLIRISRNYATSCQVNSPAGYFTEENNGITHGADWYVTYGSRQDYCTYFENSREVTFEISDIKTVTASSLPDYWNYNKDALFSFMRECLYGIKGTVKDSKGNPLNAMIQILDHDTDLDSSMVFTDPDVGDYHRPIESGTYTVIASADGFLNDTIKDITVMSENAQIVNFSLIEEKVTSVTESNKEITQLKIYPNPFNQYLEIKIVPLSSKVTISLYNTLGLKLDEKTINVNKGETNYVSLNNENFNIQDLINGIYILKISSGDQQITKIVLKE